MEEDDTTIEERQRDITLLALKMEGGDHDPEKMDGF